MSTSNVEITVESINVSCNCITPSPVKMTSSVKTTKRTVARMRKKAKRENVPIKKKRGHTPVKQCVYDKRNQQDLSSIAVNLFNTTNDNGISQKMQP